MTKLETIADQIVELLIAEGHTPDRSEIIKALKQRRQEVAQRLDITPQAAQQYFTEDMAQVWAKNILAGAKSLASN